MASHEATSYVITKDIKRFVEGQEQRILDAVSIHWPQSRKDHIDCPYPEHGGKNDWRWDDRKKKAFCTCAQKGDSIFDVMGRDRVRSRQNPHRRDHRPPGPDQNQACERKAL